MAGLKLQIADQGKVVYVSGRDTFRAKELIKSAGRARWEPDKNRWRIDSLNIQSSELEVHFQGFLVEIEVLGFAGSDSPSTANITVTTVTLDAPLPPPAKLPESFAGNPPPYGKLPASLSVLEFTTSIQRVLDRAFPRTIFVHGVIVSVKKQQNGRVFMELGDLGEGSERVSAVVWGNADQIFQPLTKAGFELQSELPVMLEVRVGLNPRGASVSLRIVGVVAEYSVARLAAQREQTNQRLRDEKLFDLNRRIPITFLPRKLVLLTSPGGTVINDFRSALDQAEFGFELVWIHVTVQGDGAKQSILTALEKAQTIPGADAVLLFRGGGSMAELSVFNDYEIARAITQSRLPVLAAIGHEEDQTSAQDVAWKNFGVPKDLGRFFFDRIVELRQHSEEFVRAIAQGAEAKIEFEDRRLLAIGELIPERGGRLMDVCSERVNSSVSLLLGAAQGLLSSSRDRIMGLVNVIPILGSGLASEREQRLAGGVQKLVMFGDRSVERATEQLARFELLTSEASPERQLQRGFVIVRSADDLVLSGSALERGAKVSLEFADSRRQAIIEDEKE